MTQERQRASLTPELDRLKQDFASRQEGRPMPHSVAVAYRQVIANYERITESSNVKKDPRSG
jgi:hypothetical protein